MPSIARKAFLCSAGLIIAAVAACGSPNSTATFDPEESVHPADWLPARHMIAARESTDTCRQCHGLDLMTGGISGIGCTGCHLGGPTDVHPETFSGFPWLQGGHGRYVAANGTAACKNVWCHGANLQGVAQSGPSCRECHDFP